MYPVTQDFLDKMKATERRVYGRLQIDYTDPFLDQSISVSASEQANVSFPAQTADAVTEPYAKYAALDGTWVLGEDWTLAPGPDEAATKQMGWWGSQLAGADGSYTAPYPTLTVTFFSRPITQLKVVGDSKRGEYPIDFDINLYDANGTILYTETVIGNTQITWQKTLANPVTQVTKMDLVIKKWSHPGRQVKILEFFTSIQETYEGDDILLIHLLEEREVSQGSLPVGNISANEVDIRLNNSTRKFDAGNTQSPLYQLLKQNRRIKAWLGLKGDGEGTNLQQSVDFTQGTLNNLVVVNNKLQLPSVGSPSFSRNSIAYLSDGTLVNTNLPRYEAGKFGNAIMIEEGTTNLVSNPSFETDSNSDGMADNWYVWVRNTGDSSRTHNNYRVPALFGNGYAQHIEITAESNTNPSALSQGGIVVSPNITYTFSFYGRASVANKVGFSIQWRDSSNSLIREDVATQRLGTTVSRVSFTATAPSNASTVLLIIFGISNVGEWFEVEAVQLEAKPYATSFIDGTRSPETLTIPTAGVLNPQEGTIEFRVYPFNTVKTLDYDRALFTTTGILPGVFWCNIMPNQQLRFVYDCNGGGVTLTGGTVPNLSWSCITIRWNTSGVACFINGVLVASNPRPITAISGAVLYIGSYNTQYHANILINDLRISNRARTDEEIAAAYASGQPLPVDEYTTYKLNFDGNLNFGQGGYWLSPQYDLSAVGTAATSKISWQEDADGVQRTVYAKLDNQADWTQVVNSGKLPIGYGDILTGRKLQLKAKLIKSA